jgi:uncharacterized delta-60 repeat protein
LTISGSTTIVGNQRITGSVNISGSTTQVGDMILTGSLTISGSSTFRNIGPTILSGSVDISGSINSDGYELAASSTSTIAALNSEFNVNFGGSAFVNKTLVLGDSKVLVAGRFFDIESHTSDDIARFNSNGTIDTSFTAPSIGGGLSATSQVINNFVTQSNDKIIIVGSFTEVDGSSYSGIARLNSNGTLDNTFTNPALTSFTEVRDVIIQNDNKIVVVGNFDGGIKRLNTNGTIDTSLVVNDSTGFTNDSFYAVALQTTGSTDYLLVGGSFLQWDTLTNYKRIARIGISGSLDTTYAGTNLNITSTGGLISKIKLDSNNDVYIAGKFVGSTNRHRNIAKLITDADYTTTGPGELDSTFQTWLSGGTNDGWVRDFTIVDGKVLIGGEFGFAGQSQNGTQYSVTDFVIVNESDGAPIDNWSSGNYIFNNVVYSVTSLGGNNVLVGGNFSTVNSISREDLASLKTSGIGTTTTTSDYSITADTNQLLISSSNTYFSGDITASTISGSFVGDGSGLTGLSTINTGSFAVTGSNTFKAEQTISSSLIVTDIIKGTGSIFLQPDLNDSRDFRIYNTAPSDIHIKGNAAYSFFGDDTNYLKIDDNTGITSIVGVNGVVITGAVTASSFTGSFVGDGSGLTGVGSSLPSDILSSSVTNFTDYSQSVDTRINSIVTGTGFATTGSNTFVGNQIVTGSLTLSSSAAVELRVVGDSVLSGSLTVTGSITVPGSGSFVNFVANPSTMRSIRGNGAGLYNIVEQSDGNMTFTVSKIGTRDLTGAITSNISGSTINGSFSDNTTTTSGAGKGARLRGVISGGTVTSLQIETANSSLGYEEEGQPASRQGIGYKAGDTVTINQSLNQVSGTLTITLRQQDIDTYFGVHNGFSFDYKNYSRLLVGGDIVTSGSITVGSTANTLGGINGNSIAAGEDVDVTSDYSIAVGRDLYNDYTTGYANATFGLHHSSSNYAQTIVGIASRLEDTGEGAFVVGNGTTSIGGGSLTRSNLLVAQGNKVEISGSLQISGSISQNGLGVQNIVISDAPITTLTTATGLTVIGYGAGEDITTGYDNTFIGNQAGGNNDTGYVNTFVGAQAGALNTTGIFNTFVGRAAGQFNITGEKNTYIGTLAGQVSTGNYNTFLGSNAGALNTSAGNNTFIGTEAGSDNTLGTQNTFVGRLAGENNSVGNNNTILGASAGNLNESGSNNTLVGKSAGYSNTIGNRNTLLGTEAGEVATSGDDNLMLGYKAGAITNNVQNLTNSNTSIFLGSNARGVNNASNQIVIGALAEGNGSNTTTIGNSSTTATYLKGTLNVSTAILAQVSSSYNFADDTAAQAGGVPLGGLYHTSGSVKIRLA